MKSYNMMLKEKQQKIQHYHPAKLTNIGILQVKSNDRTKKIYIFSFRKSFEKTNKETI